MTAEEVALAIARLEAKRDAENARRATTLPLGEAIDQLGLKATPEELAAEVVFLREEKERQEQLRQQKRHGNRILGTGAAVGIGFISLLVLLVGLAPSRSQRSAEREMPTMAMLPMQKLATIPDNRIVHIDSDTLVKLAEGEVTPAQVSVDTRVGSHDKSKPSTMFNNEWAIVRSNGVLMVRGWATAELALNITNDATGALFSSRPGWLPADNLVPVQVPVYRLEDQSPAYYLPNGKGAETAANSTLVAINVTDTPTAAKDLIRNAILAADDNFIAQSAEGWSHVNADVSDNVVRLTGNATTQERKKLAEETANETIQRLHLPYTISNELAVAQTEE